MSDLFKWPDCSRNPTDDVVWLQRLVDILHPDLIFDGEPLVGADLEIEFFGCCYLDHTMRLVEEHIQKYLQEVQDANNRELHGNHTG